MKELFIVEDDNNIREMLSYALVSYGFKTKSFENSTEFFNELRTSIPELIILDIMLPNMDGIEVLGLLKSNSKTKDIPVIFLTAKGNELDKVKGLDSGADDYITKPFSIIEFISRIKAVLRRINKEELENIIIGSLEVDENRRKVFVNKTEIILTYKEFELLLLLSKSKEIVISREKMINKIWGFDFEGESRTVDMHIKTLRKKLLECGNMIKTVRNVGYKIEV